MQIGTRVQSKVKGLIGTIRFVLAPSYFAVEFDQHIAGYMHHCEGFISSGKGRWMGPNEFDVIGFEDSFHGRVMSYIYKELRQ